MKQRVPSSSTKSIGMATAVLAAFAIPHSVLAFPEDNPLAMPSVGAHWLRILTPKLLELTLITTKSPDEPPSRWTFVDEHFQANLPTLDRFRVTVDGQDRKVAGVGFKRRVLYAPLKRRDLRIANELYLQIEPAVNLSQKVIVTDPDGTLWNAATAFTAKADPMRWSPAIHVNQVGYAPDLPKSARVGFYAGSLGEMALPSTVFHLIRASDGRPMFTGKLIRREDRRYTYPVQPYQAVYEADFSDFKMPGEYRLQVPGLGVSFPFRIHAGIPAAFARTYALGLYHQRCGTSNALPFTRFTHGPCHTAPAEVPTPAFQRVQSGLAGESANFKDNPRHTAPQLKRIEANLYPFVKTGPLDVSGGHHDAGDYSKYTTNSAQLIHHLVFAVDAFTGVGDLDNLGLPESGDGKSDVLQIARWEAEFLAKMQDSDGGFYFLVYPRDRAYENDVLPDRGDPQVVFPKTTAVTAAAVAALAQIGSSPRFKREFPADAARYLAQAKRGWVFLQGTIQRYGWDGAYQKITHYGDTFMHDDEMAWAATELFLATDDPAYQKSLLERFDPSDPQTRRWGWVHMFEGYGCAIRSYAFAEKTGRLKFSQLDPGFLKKCREEILAGGRDALAWSKACAYGTSFPTETKRFKGAGWYFPMDPAFDITVAAQIDPGGGYLSGILGNLNYEAGTNPNNVTFLTGLGSLRQRETVNQYALNDRRTLPPTGLPIGSIQEGFMYLEPYKAELGKLNFPPDGDPDRPYPFYDRWGDSFNVATEFVIVNQARGLAVDAWLMARTPLKTQPYRSLRAKITGLPAHVQGKSRFTVRLSVEGMDLRTAKIVWETGDREPSFGLSRSVAATEPGWGWIEAEAQWPDGRRAFAVADY